MNPILNLVYPEKSQVKYDLIQFPDGQQQVVIDVQSLFLNGEYPYTHCIIKSRLNNFKDLEIIICAVISLNNLDIKDITLNVPYFLGSRSDRKFEPGSNNYLKDIICPIINNLNLNRVIITDPHSDVLEACLNNFRKNDNLPLIQWVLNTKYGSYQPNDCAYPITTNINIISPDAGANKKIYSLAEKINYQQEIITCSKHRDETGKITKTIVPHFDITKDSIIIDDICDGGKTFIEIGKIIKERQENHEKENSYLRTGKIYLIVTHGIFSKGYKELNRYFDGIYCTNSYKDVPETEWDGDKIDIPTNVKQYNIF